MEPSGKFVLRTGVRLHEQLKELAQQEGVSLNQICIERLTQSAPKSPMQIFTQLPFQPLGLLRYGSVSRGEATAVSDIDWLLLVPVETTIDRALYDVIDQQRLPLKKISLHLAHLPQEDQDYSNFWLELAIDAEVLWDQNGAIHLSLISVRRAIAAGRYQRFLTHGQPYWVRNTNAQSKAR
jgi:hypothetical protein